MRAVTALLLAAGILAGQAAAGATLEDAIAQRVRDATGLDEAAVEFTWAKPIPADGRLTAFAFEPGTREITGRIVGAGGGSVAIEGRVRLLVEVPVPLRAMVAGQSITPSDLQTVRLDHPAIRPGILRAPEAALGRTARRQLEAGKPILARDLATPRAVARNDIVTLEARRGAAVVRGRGKALEPGAVGEPVRVQNVDSRRVVTGIVTSPGLVEIKG